MSFEFKCKILARQNTKLMSNQEWSRCFLYFGFFNMRISHTNEMDTTTKT